MANKLFDVVVKTGTYQKGGETKNRYENIGVVMDNGDGPFMLLKKTFNPAGVPDLKGDNSDMLLVSMFQPQDQGQSPQRQAPAPQQGGFGNPSGQPAPQPKGNFGGDYDPFSN